MKRLICLILIVSQFVSLALPQNAGKMHAVLVSGAPSFVALCGVNYSMEVEIARMYRFLVKHGIPSENIIVIARGDSIINNTECNPWPGHIYASREGQIDYSENFVIDYQGEDQTKDNFLAVIKGDKNGVKGGSGRVLESGPDDTIFLFHSGHGKPGTLQIGDGNGLTVEELNDAFKSMKGTFSQLVYFVSACYSGSMFEGKLDPNGQIFALTDADPEQESQMIQCYSDLLKNGRPLCFVAQFNTALFGDIHTSNLTKEHLWEQVEYIKTEVNLSPVSEYGNLNIAKESTTCWEGNGWSKADCKTKIGNVLMKARQDPALKERGFPEIDLENADSIYPKSPLMGYLAAKRELKRQYSDGLADKVKQMEQERVEIQKITKAIVTSIVGESNANIVHILTEMPKSIANSGCHHKMIRKMETKCPMIAKSPFVNEFIAPMTHLCNNYYDENQILSLIENQCH